MYSLLITGGAGYIGTHVLAYLLNDGQGAEKDNADSKDMNSAVVSSASPAFDEIVVVDNDSTGNSETVRRLAKDHNPRHMSVVVYNVDLRDVQALQRVFIQHPSIVSVVHLAAKKSVAESARHPLEYYSNNVSGTVNLLLCMQQHSRARNIVFSSSATVYGAGGHECGSPFEGFVEYDDLNPTSVYGETKCAVEKLLHSVWSSDPKSSWNVCILRYFNPVGAAPEFDIGEEAFRNPSPNLLPSLIRAAHNHQQQQQLLHCTVVCQDKGKINNDDDQHKAGDNVFVVYGTDYDTEDGTAVRDYVHVRDLAQGHVSVLRFMLDENDSRCKGFSVYNLGTGKGTSVEQMIQTFKRTTGVDFPVGYAEAREGDVAVAVANVCQAERQLGWTCQYDLQAMCADAWIWHCKSQNLLYSSSSRTSPVVTGQAV